MELDKEIGPQHPLHEFIHGLIVVAKSSACDDVLCINVHNSEQLFVVHLVWNGKIDPFPTKFPSWYSVTEQELLELTS